MKNFLISGLCLLSFTMFGQHAVYLESGVNKVGSNNHLGYVYLPNNKNIGLYCTFGGNFFEKMVGLNNSLVLGSKGDFQSSVSWYTKEGTSYQTLPANEIFTSPEWGNRLLETGTCVNTVEYWIGNMVTVAKMFNAGIVIQDPKNPEFRYRLGGGIRNIQQAGQVDYRYWQHRFNVSKYYDEWGVIAQPNGIFVVEHSGRVTERNETKLLSTNETNFNINVAIEMCFYSSNVISLGYNSKGGINFGIGYTF